MISGSEGGMIVTSDSNLAIKARKFAGIGYKNLTRMLEELVLHQQSFKIPIMKGMMFWV